MNQQLLDQVVVVTGGAALEKGLGDNVVFVHSDVSKPETANKAVELATTKFGKPTGVVNNTNAYRQKPFTDLEQEWDLSFGTGFEATKNFMLAAYPHLKDNGGAIVNLASGA